MLSLPKQINPLILYDHQLIEELTAIQKLGFKKKIQDLNYDSDSKIPRSETKTPRYRDQNPPILT